MNTKIEDKNIIAVALISSGLDSLLAARLIKDQGIDVRGVTFFFRWDPLAERIKEGRILKISRSIGIPIKIIDLSEDFMVVLKNPAHGFGSGVNPCIDCHLLMIQKAADIMKDLGGEFIITGEVVGQRPMSQSRSMLIHIEKVSGYRGRILRPLCAKLLPLTIPEERGWVDRERLLGITGRSRKVQLQIAKKIGIENYGTPAGGCILTDPGYSRRVKTFFNNVGKDSLDINEMILFRYGRHIWPESRLHVIVGRNEEENHILERFCGNRWVFSPEDGRGPVVLVNGIENYRDMIMAAEITASYSSGETEKRKICFEGDGTKDEFVVDVRPKEDFIKWIV